MDAKTFDERFQRLVVKPAATVGFEPWGKSLWWHAGGVRVAVLRTERYHIWPFEFTLVAGHDFLRDFEDRRPAPRSRNPDHYPVKIPPSEARTLIEGYRYEPYNLGRWPQDVMDEQHVDQQLAAIGEALVDTVPLLPERLTPEVVLNELLAHGEGAWVEKRWIEDYREHLLGTAT